jgi:hypothetical protein
VSTEGEMEYFLNNGREDITKLERTEILDLTLRAARKLQKPSDGVVGLPLANQWWEGELPVSIERRLTSGSSVEERPSCEGRRHSSYSEGSYEEDEPFTDPDEKYADFDDPDRWHE